MRKLSEKHWLAVVIFAVLMAIMDIVSGPSAFGATLVYDDNGTRKVECIDMCQEDYVELTLAYKEHRIDLVNFREPRSTWYHFVSKTGSDIWLTEEEGQEMLKYLERMFGWQTW